MCVFYLSERNRVQRWSLSCHKNSKSYQVFWICLISVRTTYSRLTQTNTHTISLLIYTKKHFIPQEQVLEKRKSSFSPLPSDFELQSENRRIAIRILIWPRSTRSICPRNDLKQRFIVALLTECVIDDFFLTIWDNIWAKNPLYFLIYWGGRRPHCCLCGNNKDIDVVTRPFCHKLDHKALITHVLYVLWALHKQRALMWWWPDFWHKNGDFSSRSIYH